MRTWHKRLVLAVCVVAWLAFGNGLASVRTNPTHGQQRGNSAKKASISDMRKQTFNFWLLHGPDKQYGGFHATLDRQGNAISPTNKKLVQQARHLWAFSALLASGKQPESAAAARSAADSLFSFMKTHMLTEVKLDSKGAKGRAFVNEVSRDGKTVYNPSINVYAKAFAIYGLSKYAQVTRSSEALNLALDTLKTLDVLYRNAKTGGYDESGTIGGLVFDSVKLMGTNGLGKPQLSQSFNTLLHMTEALAELSRATGGRNRLVQDRLLEHVKLLTGPLVVRPDSSTAYILPNYDPRTWRPVDGYYVSYGHNVEAAWLISDAVDQLQSSGTINGSTAAKMKAVLQQIGVTAVRLGADPVYGGFYDGGSKDKTTPTNKVWWVQAEAMLAYDWLYRRTGQQQYKDKLYATKGFVQQQMMDWKYGEWYWQVARQGGRPLAYMAGSTRYNETVKGNEWKASYHTGRALLLLESRGY